MKFLAQIVSGIVWVVGFVISALAKLSPIIDDSISVIAGIIGIIGGIVWVSILVIKKKKVKIELEIKEIELQNLKAE